MFKNQNETSTFTSTSHQLVFRYYLDAETGFYRKSFTSQIFANMNKRWKIFLFQNSSYGSMVIRTKVCSFFFCLNTVEMFVMIYRFVCDATLTEDQSLKVSQGYFSDSHLRSHHHSQPTSAPTTAIQVSNLHTILSAFVLNILFFYTGYFFLKKIILATNHSNNS